MAGSFGWRGSVKKEGGIVGVGGGCCAAAVCCLKTRYAGLGEVGE